jgi:hypothetical protein
MPAATRIVPDGVPTTAGPPHPHIANTTITTKQQRIIHDMNVNRAPAIPGGDNNDGKDILGPELMTYDEKVAFYIRSRRPHGY